jgi:hypothetical protein
VERDRIHREESRVLQEDEVVRRVEILVELVEGETVLAVRKVWQPIRVPVQTGGAELIEPKEL